MHIKARHSSQSVNAMPHQTDMNIVRRLDESIWHISLSMDPKRQKTKKDS